MSSYAPEPGFWPYMVFAIGVIGIGLGVVETVGLSPRWAFMGGFIASLPIDLARQRFQAAGGDERGE